MRKARNRDPTRRKKSRLLREILDRDFAGQLNIDFNPKKPRGIGLLASTQASASQPTGSAHNLDTPLSPTIANSTHSSPILYDTPLAGTLHPPAVGGQPVSSPVPNLLAPNTPTRYHAQGPTPRALAVMDPNDIDDNGYTPRDPPQGTSNVNFGTTDTWDYFSPPSVRVWNTQGQHNMNGYPAQTPTATGTSSQQAWVQQLQPNLFELASIQLQSVKMKTPGQQQDEWAYVDVLLNWSMRRSYITLVGVGKVGCSLYDLTPFPPGEDQAWTRDGGPAPTHWVTVDITGYGIFNFQQTREHIAVHPSRQPPGSNVGLIMGWDLGQRLLSQAGSAVPDFQFQRN